MYTVEIELISSVEAPKLPLIVGRATLTILPSMIAIIAPSIMVTIIIQTGTGGDSAVLRVVVETDLDIELFTCVNTNTSR